MAIFPKLIEKFRKVGKPAVSVYPILVIALIPILLAINTWWNLRSFNRDANFLIRNQAVSTADTLKPALTQNITDQDSLDMLIRNTVNANEEIVSTTLLKQVGNDLEIVSTSDNREAEEAKNLGLNQLAIGFGQSFAGLTYDAKLSANVWNVVVPLEIEGEENYLLALKFKTDSVSQILSRTSRDSFIILGILIVVTLALLANHFLFYKRALKAKQLEELDKLKDEFISMAAHDLKAPITGLVGYLDLLRNKISPDQMPAVKEDLDTLDILINDLKNLINDLLDVSRIEQGRLTIESKQTDVNEIIKTVINSLKPTAAAKNLSISFVENKLPTIETDPNRVRQVLTNLISNSIKYTLQGEITVKAKVKDKSILITVRDTGIGIPPEHLQKLFTKFHRVKDEKTKEVRGTGLGLWITKQIVEILGGEINAESIYGTGTSISFSLPLKVSN